MGYRNRINENQDGFTILETMIALAIFLVCVVPLTTGLIRVGKVRRSMDMVTASCLLQQQYAIIQSSPRLLLPRSEKIIDENKWVIETSSEGGELKKYTVTVLRGNKEITTGRMYVYDREEP